jgi:hypothetical protein
MITVEMYRPEELSLYSNEKKMKLKVPGGGDRGSQHSSQP